MNGVLLKADVPGGERTFSPSSSTLILYGAVVEGLLVAGAWVLWRVARGGSVFALIPPGPGGGPGADTYAGQVLLGAVLAAVLAGAVLGVRAVWGGFREAVDPVARRLFGSADLPALVLVSLMAGFAEELFFRGALQNLVGLVPAAVLFALAHCGLRRELWAYGLTALFLGIVLGLAYRWAGGLVLPMTAHFLYDVLVSAALKRPGRETGPEP